MQNICAVPGWRSLSGYVLWSRNTLRYLLHMLQPRGSGHMLRLTRTPNTTSHSSTYSTSYTSADSSAYSSTYSTAYTSAYSTAYTSAYSRTRGSVPWRIV